MKAWSRAISKKADVAQSVVRRIGSAEVTGPIPVISSKKTPGDILRAFFYLRGRSPR